MLLAACASPKEATTTGGVHIGYGFPGGNGVFLNKTFYVVLFDTARKIPQWVSYRLTRADLEGTAERTDDFRPDPDLPVGSRSELEDYRGSSYDRGHMAPAADFTRSPEAMSETFLLSNMAPQRPALNRGIWATLEEDIRTLARSRTAVWIITGCLFLDSLDRQTAPRVFIGLNRVAVPTHFYKVILCESDAGPRQMYAFVLANNAAAIPGKPGEYLRSVDAVEAISGLDFFSSLDDGEEDRLEALVPEMWVYAGESLGVKGRNREPAPYASEGLCR